MSSPQEASKIELTALSQEEMAPLFLSLQTPVDNSFTITPMSELYKYLDRCKSRHFRGEKNQPRLYGHTCQVEMKDRKNRESINMKN